MGVVLVTGANGHLGGRLVRALSEGGHEVRLGMRKKTPLQNRPQVLIDLEMGKDFKEALQGVETIIHLAALNAQDCEKDPQRAELINVSGTQHLVDSAKAAGVENMIYFSTIHVYGTPLSGNLSESAHVQPANVYAKTHYEAEKICLGFADLGARRALCLRLSNSLGAPVHPAVNTWMLIANDLCKQAVTQGKIELKSSGEQLRNFVAISEIERFLLAALKMPELPQGIFNFGSPYTISIWNLAQLIQKKAEKILGQKIPLTRPEPKAGDQGTSFEFPLTKINELNFKLGPELGGEIENLLLQCRQWFA